MGCSRRLYCMVRPRHVSSGRFLTACAAKQDWQTSRDEALRALEAAAAPVTAPATAAVVHLSQPTDATVPAHPVAHTVSYSGAPTEPLKTTTQTNPTASPDATTSAAIEATAAAPSAIAGSDNTSGQPRGTKRRADDQPVPSTVLIRNLADLARWHHRPHTTLDVRIVVRERSEHERVYRLAGALRCISRFEIVSEVEHGRLERTSKTRDAALNTRRETLRVLVLAAIDSVPLDMGLAQERNLVLVDAPVALVKTHALGQVEEFRAASPVGRQIDSHRASTVDKVFPFIKVLVLRFPFQTEAQLPTGRFRRLFTLTIEQTFAAHWSARELKTSLLGVNIDKVPELHVHHAARYVVKVAKEVYLVGRATVEHTAVARYGPTLRVVLESRELFREDGTPQRPPRRRLLLENPTHKSLEAYAEDDSLFRSATRLTVTTEFARPEKHALLLRSPAALQHLTLCVVPPSATASGVARSCARSILPRRSPARSRRTSSRPSMVALFRSSRSSSSQPGCCARSSRAILCSWSTRAHSTSTSKRQSSCLWTSRASLPTCTCGRSGPIWRIERMERR